MTSTALSPRQQLLVSLCNDLNAQGWNQKHKLWYVKGEPDDEWLVFDKEFSGPPENHLLDLITAQALPEDAHGVLVVTEGWAYPKRILDSFRDTQSLAAYWRTTPPDEHPERVELRHLLLACGDGEVIALTHTNQAEPTTSWARVDASTPCPVGDKTVDAARALLGLNEPLVNRLTQIDSLQALASIASAVEQAMAGEQSEEETTRNLFFALPEPMRLRLLKDMPEDIRDIVRRALSDEERGRYGL